VRLRFFQSSSEIPVSGVILLGFSIVYFALVFWHFQWLRRQLPFLTYWGRSPWRFPASRRGALISSLLGLTLGLGSIDSYFGVVPKVIWGTAAVFMISLTIMAGLVDYRSHKKSQRRPG
jgi:hypothetical protein